MQAQSATDLVPSEDPFTASQVVIFLLSLHGREQKENISFYKDINPMLEGLTFMT